MKKIVYSTLMLVLVLAACANTNPEATDKKTDKVTVNLDQDRLDGLSKAYFASGCFWCVEAIFESVEGVEEVVSGYAGGEEVNPTYQQVSAGMTSHAEAVEVFYDPTKITFKTLVKVFFGSHDPTTLSQQGPDKGAQYRSIAFYTSVNEKEIIENYIAKLKADNAFDGPITTEVKPLDTFYDAEDYHQNYEVNNPGNPYVQGVSIPRLKRFQSKFPELLKKNH